MQIPKWLLIGGLIIFGIGIIATGIYTAKRPASVIEKPEKEISKEIELMPAIDIADWKTYKNREYGYEVKFPPTWAMEEVLSTVWWNSPETTPVTPERRFIQAGVINHIEGYSIPEILLVQPTNCKDIVVGNIKFCRLKEKFASRQSTFYALSRNNKVYFLRLDIEGGRQREGYYLPESQFQNELNVFNQMLSTFKFTK